MEQINNITEEINNNDNITNKTKKEYKFTEKKKLAYEKMKEAKKEARKNMMKINGDKYILDKSFGVK